MNARQQKILDRFGQVQTFLDTNTNTVPPATVAGLRQVLAGAVTQINGFVQDQVTKGTESVVAQTLSSARTSLRDTYMRQLSTIGLHRLTGQNTGDPSVPNAKQIFTLPATHTNSLTLIAAANAMVAAATPYSSIFTAAGTDFDAVNGAIQALQAALIADGSGKRVSKGATQGIRDQIKTGQGAVRMMDAIVRPRVAGNKALLAQWESVKRAAGGLNLAPPVPTPAVPASVATSAPTQAGTTQAGTSGSTDSSSTQRSSPSSGSATSTTSTGAPVATGA